MPREYVEFRVRVKKVTDLAMLCKLDTGEEVWFPKSQVDLEESEASGEGDIGTISVTEFIAAERGLV